MFPERVTLVVSPDKADGIAGSLGNQVVLHHHVGEVHHRAAVPAHDPLDLLQIVEIDLLRASPFLAQGRAPPSGAQPDFVEPDHRLPAAEVGEELVEQLFHELQRPRVGRTEVVLDRRPRHVFRQVLVPGPVKPALHVAEGVLVRHELDEALAAVPVQLEDLLSGQRRVAPPHLGVVLIGEGVLGVELKLVDLEVGEPVDEQLEAFHGGDAPAADVELHPPVGEIGPIANDQVREAAPAAVLAGDLQQRLDAVEKASLVVSGESDTSPQNRELVPLLPADPARIDREDTGGLAGTGSGEPESRSGDQLQSLADRPAGPQQAIPVSPPELDPAIAFTGSSEIELSAQEGQLSRCGEQDEVTRHSGEVGTYAKQGWVPKNPPLPDR